MAASYDTATPYIASYLLVRNPAGKVAFVLRSNTSWMNNFYGLPSGKVEKDESFIQGALREAEEELGIRAQPQDLRQVLTVHRNASGEAMSWVDVFFEVERYEGEAHNAEPHMHSQLDWFDLAELPENTIPSLRFALEQLVAGKSYVEYGWDGESEDSV